MMVRSIFSVVMAEAFIYVKIVFAKKKKKALKAIMRQCKSGDRDKYTNKLKEIIADDRKS